MYKKHLNRHLKMEIMERIKMVCSLTNIGCRLSSVIPLDGG